MVKNYVKNYIKKLSAVQFRGEYFYCSLEKFVPLHQRTKEAFSWMFYFSCYFFAYMVHYDADKCMCHSFQNYIMVLTNAYRYLLISRSCDLSW